jgi:dynein heavy chain 1
LHAEVIPKQWRQYVVANISVSAWLVDFVKRVEQLKKLTASKDFGQSGLWFGGLLYPEAYLTATRQAVAQKNNWSLEDVVLKFEIDVSPEEENSQGFILTGFSMQGAEYSRADARVRLTEKISAEMPAVNFKWVHVDQAKKEAHQETISIPVYLNKQRTNLLTAVSIPTYGVPPYIWY